MKKRAVLFFTFISLGVFAQKKVQNLTVAASCGMCQFNIKADKDCAMTVKIDRKYYQVIGLPEKTFGDAHAKDGYCEMIKKAVVTGEIKNGKFYASEFDYVK